MSMKSDFKIGCKVIPASRDDAFEMEVPIDTIGIVTKIFSSSSADFIDVKWPNGIMAISEEWYMSRFILLDGKDEVLGDFCICGSTNTVQNSVLNKSFIYCRNCKKERK